MSQRREQVDESIVVNLQLRVDIKSFSNHNGFGTHQVKNAIEEFKDEISSELISRLENGEETGEFLQSVDFVNFEVLKR